MSKSFNPKVSIVIPVYNGSNYVREAIDSALAQTYKNIEIVVINDGSTDGGKTDTICKSYGNKIRYYLKENGGVATALNMGIEKMEGEYFSWLSHDDVYYPEKVEKQVEELSKMHNISDIILYSNYELINENSKHLGQITFDHKELLQKPEYSILRGAVNGITLLIPKSAFERFGNFNPEFKCTQDYDLWRRFIKDYKFIHIEDYLAKTRIHELQDSNKHPNAISEGNRLWIEMMESLTTEDKIRLEGTEYNFYREMVRHLERFFYNEAEEHAREKMREARGSKSSAVDNYKVSITIPFYNRLDLLINSIDSVKNQTHKEWELILVNDKSTEDISRIEEHIKDDKRIKIINMEENGGPAVARNKGIEKSTGEYIAFLDSDDEFLPEKIKDQLLEMVLTQSNVSHTSYIRKIDGKKEEIVSVGLLDGNVIPEILGSCQIATPTVMIKKKYLLDTGLRFKEGLRIGEDTIFWFELLRNTKLLGINKAYTIVNTSSESAANHLEKHLEGLRNIIAYLLSDKEYSQYHSSIANLCKRYYEVSREISPVDEDTLVQDYSFWRNKPSNPIMKAIYLFKNQGFFFTIKKVLVKYYKRIRHKLTGK